MTFSGSDAQVTVEQKKLGAKFLGKKIIAAQVVHSEYGLGEEWWGRLDGAVPEAVLMLSDGTQLFLVNKGLQYDQTEFYSVFDTEGKA